MPVTVTASKAPPAKARPVAAPKADPRTEDRAKGLLGIAQLAQAALVMGSRFYPPLLADAGAVGMHAGPIAHEVAVLASTVEPVARVTDGLIKTGPYMALVTAVLPLVMQLAVNRGMAPAGIAGTVTPGMLESQMKASMMEAEAELLIAMKEAEYKAQKAREALEEAQQA